MPKSSYQSKTVGNINIDTDNNQVTIETKNLKLISLNQMDKDKHVANFKTVFQNEENVRLFGNGQIWNDDKVRGFIDTEVGKWQQGIPLAAFAVYDQKGMQFLGSLFTKYVPKDFAQVGAGHGQAAEIGYILDNKSWGKGYGKEVAFAGKKYIKQVSQSHPQEPIKEIVATVHPNNKASEAILKKALKQREQNTFYKGEQMLRFLFYKELKSANPSESATATVTNNQFS